MGLNTAWIVRSRGAIRIVEVISAAQEEVAARVTLAAVPLPPVIRVGIVPGQVVVRVVAVAAVVGIKEAKGNSKTWEIKSK